MRIVVNILMGLSTLIAVLMIGGLAQGLATGGFTNGAGMAILIFEIWGVIGSIGAMLFGGISYFMSRNSEAASTIYGKIGFGIGISGLLVLVLLLVFGSA